MDGSAAETRNSVEGSHLRVVLPVHEPEGSPLAAARVRRRLTVEEAAARAGLSVEDVRCLEESRIYRFPSVDQALATALVYGNALGVSEREARRLAGLPAGPRDGLVARGAGSPSPPSPPRSPRSAGSSSFRSSAADEAASGSAVAQASCRRPGRFASTSSTAREVPNAATVLANEVGGPLAYRVGTVENASGSTTSDARLLPAGELGRSPSASRRISDVGTQALPSGEDPSRLIVIVGRDRAPQRLTSRAACGGPRAWP